MGMNEIENGEYPEHGGGRFLRNLTDHTLS
jgi:hypothetical protein